MLTDEFKTIIRPNYEMRSAGVWGFASIWGLGLSAGLSIGWGSALGLCGVCGSMAIYRGLQGKYNFDRKMRLSGTKVELLPAKRLVAAMPKMGENLWLGRGWRWNPNHTAIAHELRKRTPEEIYPPPWWLKMVKAPVDPYNARGIPWIHGMNSVEEDVMIPLAAFKGHCAIIATTGAIKTVLARLIITQLVARGDTVIILDPKGDKDLREIARLACVQAGDPGKFLMLHPAFASQSVRLDLLKNWDRTSQVASRLGLVLGAGEDDSFAAFCWSAVHRITNGLKYVGERASLLKLKRCMESRTNVEGLALRMMRKYFTEERRDLLDRCKEEQNKAMADAGKSKNKLVTQTSIPELTGMVQVFKTDVADKHDDLSGIVNILDSSQEWFGKMINSILPLLIKLTTDDLKGLLSPDYDDVEDERPIMDGKRIVDGRHVLYVGTDALADVTIGKAVSAMLIAETAAVSAEIYNHGLELEDGEKPSDRRIHIFVDEWGDAMCEPLVQQANKGRGAGVHLWAMGQTFSDLVVAFGNDTASARRFMGNMNNLICGAIQDPETQQMISEQFAMTSIKTMSEGKASGGKTDDGGLEFTSNRTASVKDEEVALISVDILKNLEDLHYVASFNRSQTYKGRIPVVQM
ncbi:conjugative transfer system coupling protein TraD [Comamonas thiooxydans]|uniref:conjugative transfer system coupling protein TraD n=1 Tax=Comamonas thiooxydans TaxID=363952 RepID=UPI00055804CC|nr:conjugative transfer system coupling protein TraD [Comamonas thiooxydans]